MSQTKISKKEALNIAATAKEITMTEQDMDVRDEVVTLEKMQEVINEFGHGRWFACQYDNGSASINLLAGISFSLKVAK